MLSTKTIAKKIFLVFFSALATITNQTRVYAFEISLASSSPISSNEEFIYIYNINLESGESLEPDNLNNLILTSLAEVTEVRAFEPYSVAENGFDSTSANFEVIADLSPETNFPGVIEITSTSSVVGNIDYLAFFNDGSSIIASSGGRVLGPTNASSVPFTFSPSLGLLISASFFSVYYLKRLCRSKV